MRHVFLACVIAFGLVNSSLAAAAKEARLAYPQTRRVDQVDVYHGVRVADPYRWLEADIRTSPEVAEWVAAENKLTASYLDAIAQRATIRRRLAELWNFAHYSPPSKHGGRYYYLKNDGLQNQSVLYVADTLDGRAARAAGSQPLVEGRHDRPDGRALQRRRQIHGLRPLRGGFRLGHLASHGRRRGAFHAARRTEMDQDLLGRLDQGRQGLLLHPF